jgi:hypothetical protein
VEERKGAEAERERLESTRAIQSRALNRMSVETCLIRYSRWFQQAFEISQALLFNLMLADMRCFKKKSTTPARLLTKTLTLTPPSHLH